MLLLRVLLSPNVYQIIFIANRNKLFSCIHVALPSITITINLSVCHKVKVAANYYVVIINVVYYFPYLFVKLWFVPKR